MPPASSLELDLAPEWGAIRPTWEACREALTRGGLGEDEAYALCMVAQELLENAVKYGDAAGGQPVHLSVQNR